MLDISISDKNDNIINNRHYVSTRASVSVGYCSTVTLPAILATSFLEWNAIYENG